MDEVLGELPDYSDAPTVSGPVQPVVLTADELATIRAEARKKVEKELRDKAFAKALEEAEREERIAAGLAPKTGPTKADEPKYTVVLDLPESVTPIPAIVIDGKAYYDRQVYRDVPESLAMQLHHMQAEAWVNDSRMSRGVEKDTRRPKPQVIDGKTGGQSGAPLALRLVV